MVSTIAEEIYADMRLDEIQGDRFTAIARDREKLSVLERIELGGDLSEKQGNVSGRTFAGMTSPRGSANCEAGSALRGDVHRVFEDIDNPGNIRSSQPVSVPVLHEPMAGLDRDFRFRIPYLSPQNIVSVGYNAFGLPSRWSSRDASC